jgi:hypothetical protein
MQALGADLSARLDAPVGEYSTLVARRAFTEYFYLHWLDAIAQGEFPCVASWNELVAAIQCEGTLSDFQHFLLTCYAAAFRHAYASEIRAFLGHSGPSTILVVHVSCRPYAARARRSADTFRDASGRLKNVIVVGIPGARYSLDATTEVLTVPAGDHYEDLPSKVAAALHFIGMTGYGGTVVKVDDDICCNDGELLGEMVSVVSREADYSGRVFDPTVLPGQNRTWHIGKCASPALNWKPFSGIPHAAYAEGPIYVLSANALHALSKAWLMFSDHFSESRYEDQAVGAALSHFGIHPCHFDLRQTDLVCERSWELASA